MNYKFTYILLIIIFIILFISNRQFKLKEKFALKDFIGQSYNYRTPIPSPKQLGVSSDANLWVLPPNISAAKKYADYMSKGPELGNNFFIKSGKCSKTGSTPECQGKPRWLFIRNIPTGRVPCTDYKSSFRGFVPGIIEDIADLNPYQIFLNLSGQGSTISDNCVSRTESVGPVGNQRPQTKCAPPYKDPICFPEFFTNFKKK